MKVVLHGVLQQHLNSHRQTIVHFGDDLPSQSLDWCKNAVETVKSNWNQDTT